jgi:AraC-like DNA-binding protein
MLLAVPFLHSDRPYQEVLKPLLLREHLTRTQAARKLGFSESALNRRFPGDVGLTYRQAKTILPLAAASYCLLIDRTLSVSDVVERFRYADLTTFERRFRKFWAMSPRAFRRKFPFTEKPFWIVVRATGTGRVSLASVDLPPSNGIAVEETGIIVISMRPSY